MDKLHLIAEVYCRPALWDFDSEENKSRLLDIWKELATSMGPNVKANDCKRMWKTLRDDYQAEVKRIEFRIEKDLHNGTYDQKNDYGSTWPYFEHLKFLNDIRNPPLRKMSITEKSSSNNRNAEDIHLDIDSEGSEIEIEIEDNDHCTKSDVQTTVEPNVSMRKTSNIPNCGVTKRRFYQIKIKRRCNNIQVPEDNKSLQQSEPLKAVQISPKVYNKMNSEESNNSIIKQYVNANTAQPDMSKTIVTGTQERIFNEKFNNDILLPAVTITRIEKKSNIDTEKSAKQYVDLNIKQLSDATKADTVGNEINKTSVGNKDSSKLLSAKQYPNSRIKQLPDTTKADTLCNELNKTSVGIKEPPNLFFTKKYNSNIKKLPGATKTFTVVNEISKKSVDIQHSPNLNAAKQYNSNIKQLPDSTKPDTIGKNIHKKADGVQYSPNLASANQYASSNIKQLPDATKTDTVANEINIPSVSVQNSPILSSAKQYANLIIKQLPDATKTATVVNEINKPSVDIQDSPNLPSAKRRKITNTTPNPDMSDFLVDNELAVFNEENFLLNTCSTSSTNNSNNISSKNDNPCPTKQIHNVNNVYIKEEPVDSEEKLSPVASKDNNDCVDTICHKINVGDLDCNFLVSFLSHMKSTSQFQNLLFRAKMSNLMLSSFFSKATTETSNTVNVLQKQDQNCVLKALFDIGDPDCNFLVSFLPHMKSMSRLQNLHFRAKMSDLMLNIVSTSFLPNTASDSTT